MVVKTRLRVIDHHHKNQKDTSLKATRKRRDMRVDFWGLRELRSSGAILFWKIERSTMSEAKAPLLEIKNVKKEFFGNQVLTDINFTIHEGEVLGFCGENGAGKSTLMKILFGMDVIRETGGYEGDILITARK